MPDALIARWLSPEQAATYMGTRPDHLPRLVKAGKLPRPSYHLGPRSARYDRLALDALFSARSVASDADQVADDIVARMRAAKRV